MPTASDLPEVELVGSSQPYPPSKPDASPLANLRGTIMRAIGEASTCWENLNNAGEFDSNRAIEIGDGIYRKVLRTLNSAPYQEPDEYIKIFLLEVISLANALGLKENGTAYSSSVRNGKTVRKWETAFYHPEWEIQATASIEDDAFPDWCPKEHSKIAVRDAWLDICLKRCYNCGMDDIDFDKEWKKRA